MSYQVTIDECLKDVALWFIAKELILSGQVPEDRCVQIQKAHPYFWASRISCATQTQH